jgi:hypothetical protein
LPGSLAPHERVSLARFPLRGKPSGGVVPPGNASRAGTAVAAKTLWVTVSARGSKLPPCLTRFARGFSSRLAAQLLIRGLTGAGTTPTRGAGDMCLPRRFLTAEGRTEPASTVHSPVARDYPSPRFRPFFQTVVRQAVPTFLLVLLDQRFAIDPCLPSLVICMKRVTALESRTPHQPEKPTQRLGTLSCLQHCFLFSSPSALLIDSCSPSLFIFIKRVTSLESRTQPQPGKLQKMSKNDSVFTLSIFRVNKKNAILSHAFSVECTPSTAR